LRTRSKSQTEEEHIGIEAKSKIDDEVDALFKLPLTEFIGARNDLAARLKKAGHADDASLVKTLTKPSVSAWAVNQLYWNHREEFDRLLETSQRLRQAQRPGIADMRESIDARREVLSQLSELAAALLRDAGHNPTPDTLHRIITTLEAVCASSTQTDRPTHGRLSQDIDPPGFDSLVSVFASGATLEGRAEPARAPSSQKPDRSSSKTQKSESPAIDVQKAKEAEEMRRARIVAVKASLQEARKSLSEAQSTFQRVEAARKRASLEAKDAEDEARLAEKKLSDAMERSRKASAASNDAMLRAQGIAADAEEARQAVEKARRTIEELSNDLESMSHS
jgi:hypothetical protein